MRHEVEALMLEYALIKTHRPRFNVRLKDDKSYPWLAVTVGDDWPRPAVVRGRKRKGVRYFGPYGHVGAMRETLDLLLRSFPVRTCSDTKFAPARTPGPPLPALRHRTVLGALRRRGRARPLRGMVEDLMRFLSGDTAAGGGRPRGRDGRGGRRPRVRAGGSPARPAHRRPQGGRGPADGVRASRGLRRPRHRRGRARGGRAGSSMSAGAGWSAGAASWPTRSRT